MARPKWRLERRTDKSRLWQVAAVVIAILAAFLVSAILLMTASAQIIPAFEALFTGAFGSKRAILETLVRASPLILTGLAATMAFRAKIWNIGAEGQLVIGAMTGYLAFTLFGGLHRFLLFLLIILFSFVGGAAYGWLAGFLKVRFQVDEIISTVMLNYIAIFFLSLMLSGVGPWREEGSFYQQSAELPEVARFGVLISDSRLHTGFLIAILAAVAVWIILEKTPLGYEIRAYGYNSVASRFKGTNVSGLVMLTMAISGGLAGLAGAGELFGIHHRVVMDLSIGLGFTGIIVAMLAALDPFGVVIVSILFGGLVNGAFKLQIVTGVPSAFISAIQAIVLLFALSAAVLARYQIVRSVEDAG